MQLDQKIKTFYNLVRFLDTFFMANFWSVSFDQSELLHAAWINHQRRQNKEEDIMILVVAAQIYHNPLILLPEKNVFFNIGTNLWTAFFPGRRSPSSRPHTGPGPGVISYWATRK